MKSARHGVRFVNLLAILASAVLSPAARSTFASERNASVAVSWGVDTTPLLNCESNGPSIASIVTNADLFIPEDPSLMLFLVDSRASNGWDRIKLSSFWMGEVQSLNHSYDVYIRCSAAVTNTLVLRGATGPAHIVYGLSSGQYNEKDTPSVDISLTHNGVDTRIGSNEVVFGEPFSVALKAELIFARSGIVGRASALALLDCHFGILDVFDQAGSNIAESLTITSTDLGLYPMVPPLNIRKVSSGGELWWDSLASETYAIQSCTDLWTPTWSNLATGIAPSPPRNSLPVIIDTRRRFYQLRITQE